MVVATMLWVGLDYCAMTKVYSVLIFESVCGRHAIVCPLTCFYLARE